MERSRRAVRYGVCVLVAVVGVFVAVPSLGVGFMAIDNGLGRWSEAPPPLLLSLLLAALLTPLVLSLLLFFWRVAGRLWAAWWLVMGLAILVDALSTAAVRHHGPGTLFSVSAALWGSALLTAAVVTGLCLAQLWMAREIARLRGWAAFPTVPATSGRRWVFVPIAAWLVLAASMVLAWGPSLPFGAGRWRACEPWHAAWGDNSRAQMAEDLIAHDLRPGMTRAEVVVLLGEDDHPDIYALFPRPTLSQTLLALGRWGGPCPGLEITYAPWSPVCPHERSPIVRAAIMGAYIGYTD